MRRDFDIIGGAEEELAGLSRKRQVCLFPSIRAAIEYGSVWRP